MIGTDCPAGPYQLKATNYDKHDATTEKSTP